MQIKYFGTERQMFPFKIKLTPFQEIDLSFLRAKFHK